MSSYPTIPSTWTAPTSCFATTNYYRVLIGGGYFSNMYGTPTPVFDGNYPTGDCFPPETTPDVPYVTDGDCPTGYTRACATDGPESNGEPMRTVTCCPSVTDNVFSFMCKDNEYGCHATATRGVVWTGVITDIGLDTPTEQPVTRTPSPKEGLEAWGIKLISIAPESKTGDDSPKETSAEDTSPGEADSVPEEQASKGSGLSAGAIAGSVVGSLVGVCLLGLGVFLLLRRKSRKTVYTGVTPGAAYPSAAYPSPNGEIQGIKDVHQLDDRREPQMLESQDPHPGTRSMWELQG